MVIHFISRFTFVLFGIMLTFVLNTSKIQAQCSCTNCPLTLPHIGTVEGYLTIAGATSNVLNTTQFVKAVNINVDHDALRECEITLIAPNGSSVLLSDNFGVSSNNNITYDICILDCTGNPIPDPGFPINFTSSAPYMSGQTYTGSYYTYNGGCLSVLTGPVSGQWTLRFQDFIGLDGGVLNDWSIELANNDGTDCTFSCAESSDLCDAEGGEIDNLPTTFQYCQNDPNLQFSIIPNYDGNTPDPSLYSYVYILNSVSPDQTLEYNFDQDFTDLAPGEYSICGLSYLTADLSNLPAINGTNLIPTINQLINSNTICADFSANCYFFTVNPILLPPTITGPTEVCVGELATYIFTNPNPSVTPTIAITSGSFGLFTIVGNQIEVIWLSGPGEICISVSNACGTLEDCLQVVVNDFSLNFTISGPSPVCFGDEETYILNPSLPPGYVNVWTVSNGVITDQTDNSVTVLWNNMGTGQICYNVTDPCNNLSVNCITAVINPDAPVPVINLPATFCLDGTFNASITPSSVYTVYFWTASPAIITSGQGSPNISLTSSTIGITTVCVQVLSDCSPPQTVCRDIEIVAPPVPELQVSSVCGLEGVFEVINPINNANYFWTQVSGVGSISFSSPFSSSTGFSASQPGTYTIQVTETINGCVGINTLTVTLYPYLTISDIQFDCTDANGYILSFNINGGLPQYSVNNSPIATNTYTSGFIPFGTNYNFNVTDQQNCAETISGSELCPCVSDAGVGSQILLSICEDETAIAEEVSGELLDGNDIGVYVLHNNAGNILGTIFATSTTPEFSYLPTLQYGATYYISYIVGNEITGNVDLNDPCLSVSVGQPVIFHKTPFPFAGNDIQTCLTLFELDGINDVFGSSITWSVIIGDNVNINTPNFLNTFVNVAGPGNYQILLEENNEGCFGTDEINITVFDPITTLITSFECNQISGEYTVTFSISGGSMPYFVGGLPIIGTTFTSQPITSGSIYSFFVEDIIGCSAQLQGTYNCDCETRGGSMSSDELIVCAEGGSVSGIYNTDGIFDSNDVGMFVLHTSASNILGTVLASNTSGVFIFDPSYSLNTTYYISYVIGNELNGTVDLTDPCLGVSPGQPVIFRGNPEVVINPMTDTCALVNIISTNPEVGVQYIWSTSDPNLVFANANSASTTITASTFGDYEITLTAMNDVCSSSVSTIVTFLQTPMVTSIAYDCNDLTTFNANLTLSGFAPFTANIPFTNVSTNTLLFENLLSTATTTVLITSANGCSVTSELTFDCACQSTPGTMSSDLLSACEGDEVSASYNFDGLPGDVDSFIYILHTSATDVLGTILATSPDGRFGKIAGLDFNTIYYISYVTVNFVGGNYELQPCSFVTPGQPVIFYENPVINWDVVVDNCNPQATFTITSTGNLNNLSVVSAPFGAIIDNLTNNGFVSNLTGDYVFSITAENNGCTSIEIKQVTTFDSPLIENIFADCKGLFFDVSFEIIQGTPPYSLNGTTNITSPFTSDLIPRGDVYTFFVQDSRGCITDSQDISLECNCDTDAGTLTGSDIQLCEGDNLNPTFPNNYTLGAGDGFVYFLHDGTTQNIGNIIWQGTSFPAQYQSSFAGSSYLLVRVAGPLLSGGDIDLTDDCTDFSNSVTVTWSAKPNFVSFVEPFYCENQDILISIENSGSGTLQVFKNQNEILTFISSASGIIIDPVSIQKGDIIFYRFTDDFGCIYDLGSDEIIIQALPQAGFTGSLFESCINEINTLFLPDYINGEESGGNWFLGNAFLPIAENFIVNQNITSDTTVFYIINNQCGTDTSSFLIVRRPLPEFTLNGVDPLCFGVNNGSITVLPAFTTEVDRIEVNGQIVTNLFIQNLQPGDYEIRVFNEFGCSNSEQITLNELEEMLVDLGPDLLVDSGENIIITLASNPTLQDIVNTTWTLPDGEIITGIVYSINFTPTETSIIQITVLNRNGCTASNQITIFVREDTTILEDIVLPNIIVSGSGRNGVFTLAPYEQIQSVQSCSIYDRWGNKVYNIENVSPQEISWDGSFYGSQVIDGVFVYSLVVNLKNGKQQSFAGDITVISR